MVVSWQFRLMQTELDMQFNLIPEAQMGMSDNRRFLTCDKKFLIPVVTDHYNVLALMDETALSYEARSKVRSMSVVLVHYHLANSHKLSMEVSKVFKVASNTLVFIAVLVLELPDDVCDQCLGPLFIDPLQDLPSIMYIHCGLDPVEGSVW